MNQCSRLLVNHDDWKQWSEKRQRKEEKTKKRRKRKDLVREPEGKVYSERKQAGCFAYPDSVSVVRSRIEIWTQSTFLRVSLIALALSPVTLPV